MIVVHLLPDGPTFPPSPPGLLKSSSKFEEIINVFKVAETGRVVSLY